jgi:hypothetical protein
MVQFFARDFSDHLLSQSRPCPEKVVSALTRQPLKAYTVPVTGSNTMTVTPTSNSHFL